MKHRRPGPRVETPFAIKEVDYTGATKIGPRLSGRQLKTIAPALYRAWKDGERARFYREQEEARAKKREHSAAASRVAEKQQEQAKVQENKRGAVLDRLKKFIGWRRE